MEATLQKQERLKSKKAIQYLFLEGKRINQFPLQFLYVPYDNEEFPMLQVGFSVPKRKIPLAVHRNRIKRLLREVYRKNKHLLINELEISYVGMFIYTSDKEISYAELEKVFYKLSNEFQKKIKKK